MNRLEMPDSYFRLVKVSLIVFLVLMLSYLLTCSFVHFYPSGLLFYPNLCIGYCGFSAVVFDFQVTVLITFLSVQGPHLLKLTTFLQYSLSREYGYRLSVTFPHPDPVLERNMGLMMMMFINYIKQVNLLKNK